MARRHRERPTGWRLVRRRLWQWLLVLPLVLLALVFLLLQAVIFEVTVFAEGQDPLADICPPGTICTRNLTDHFADNRDGWVATPLPPRLLAGLDILGEAQAEILVEFHACIYEKSQPRHAESLAIVNQYRVIPLHKLQKELDRQYGGFYTHPLTWRTFWDCQRTTSLHSPDLHWPDLRRIFCPDCLPAPVQPAAQELPQVQVTGAVVNVRTGPGQEHAAVMQVQQGDVLYLVPGHIGEWLAIADPSASGVYEQLWIYGPLTTGRSES